MTRWMPAIWALAIALSGCGTAIPQVAEVVDGLDPDATVYMEKQIKYAIFCELRGAIQTARKDRESRYFKGKLVSTADDQPVPDSWGAQVTLTFTIDEASKFNPGLSFIRPMANSQSFAFGLGGTLSSQATRIDKFEAFYTVKELGLVVSKGELCEHPADLNGELGPKSMSSPFALISDLGIRRWLPDATSVSNFLRSSRKADNGEGAPLGAAVAGLNSDSFSYDVKFIVTTDGNVTPTWKLTRFATPASPALFDTSRVRTHELLITLGPTDAQPAKGKPKGTLMAGPSLAASQSHFAQEIGSAVAAAIRAQ